MKSPGKLIVIDGSDGSGKSTQVALLVERLKKEGKAVRMVDFPEYYGNFFGAFIGKCLTEKEYDFLNVHPKIASVLYAADRFESKKKIEGYLAAGDIVVANRYVSANQIHQGGKIKSPAKRREFLTFLDTMEHKVFGIPRPNVVIYLDLPVSVSLKLMEERNKKADRAYAGKKKDVHETSLDFLKNSRAAALWLSDELPYFKKIECAPKNRILTREEIHESVYKLAKKVTK